MATNLHIPARPAANDAAANDGEEPATPSSAGSARRLPPLSDEQQRLVQMGLSMVERCAAEVARRYRDLVTAEELLATGAFALHEAALAYHEDRHPSFLHFAKHHVQGRMLDAIRAEHFSLRARVEHAMDRAYCRFSTHQTLDVDLFADDEAKLLDGARRGCADLLAATFLAGLLEAQQASPEEAVAELEGRTSTHISLQEALATLPPEEQATIQLAYGKGMTLGEVADALGVHVNTAKNRHVSALEKLRALLVGRGETG
ncbi:MAG: sigma-70 family RNA polymerase sigma factor [Minicystis sp.]